MKLSESIRDATMWAILIMLTAITGGLLFL
jgi:hypothetical protein